MTVLWTKREDLHVEAFDDSLVAYDLDAQQVHRLGDQTSRVFDASTGVTADAMARVLDLPIDEVLAQLKALDSIGLVAASAGQAGVSRKNLLLAGAAATAGAAVLTLNAPRASAASSGGAYAPPANTLASAPPTNPTSVLGGGRS